MATSEPDESQLGGHRALVSMSDDSRAPAVFGFFCLTERPDSVSPFLQAAPKRPKWTPHSRYSEKGERGALSATGGGSATQFSFSVLDSEPRARIRVQTLPTSEQVTRFSIAFVACLEAGVVYTIVLPTSDLTRRGWFKIDLCNANTGAPLELVVHISALGRKATDEHNRVAA